jgi:hypothetical protein
MKMTVSYHGRSAGFFLSKKARALQLLAMLFVTLFAASCTDHEVPVLTPAKIKTLELHHGLPTTFFVQFEDLGNIPITEYGIAMSTGVSGFLVNKPTVDDEILPFPAAINLDVKSHKYNVLFADANYRAYAKLSNGTVVYGEVLKFRFQPGG